MILGFKIFFGGNLLKIFVSAEYLWEVPQYFHIKRPGEKVDLQNISDLNREKLRREYFKRGPANNFFIQTTDR